MRRGAKSISTIERVEAEVDKVNSSGILPPGVHIEKIYDRSDLIHVTTRTVLHNMAAGIVLIFLLQWAFLGNLRSAVIVAMTIPFALSFAIGLMVLALVATLLVAGPLIVTPVAAQGTAEGTAGQTLTVSRTTGLDPAGEVVTVTGTGYDQSKGIYVSFCVLPPPGQKPTPCAGGIDLTGTGGGAGLQRDHPSTATPAASTPHRARSSSQASATE